VFFSVWRRFLDAYEQKGKWKKRILRSYFALCSLCYRTLPWESFVRRYRDHDHWHNLRPDAFVAYQAGGQRVRFWLEWDRARLGTRVLGAKLRTYEHYVTSSEWFKQEAALPMLLIVAP